MPLRETSRNVLRFMFPVAAHFTRFSVLAKKSARLRCRPNRIRNTARPDRMA